MRIQRDTLWRTKIYAYWRVLVLFLLTAQFSHAESGISPTTITIEMSSPFSGPTGAYGSEMRDAINTIIDDTNREGGIYGRKIELVTMDDGYETERAVANTKKLIEEKKVFALVGYYASRYTQVRRLPRVTPSMFERRS
jgi:branched-chain amino acid transport system substrate-binding protein